MSFHIILTPSRSPSSRLGRPVQKPVTSQTQVFRPNVGLTATFFYWNTDKVSVAITLNQQSLRVTTPSSTNQFIHHLSLLTSRSDSQRRDSLSYLTSATLSRPNGAPLPQPTSLMLLKLLPLTVDGNNGVRIQLLKLLRCLPSGDVEDGIEQILLYVRAGLTHLAPDIRNTSLDVLLWTLEVAGQRVVTCRGGWTKTLKCLLAVLGWPNEVATGSDRVTIGKAGMDSKGLVKCLSALATFLDVGLHDPLATLSTDSNSGVFPLWTVNQHLLARSSDQLAYLGLFGSSTDRDDENYEDKASRQRIFKQSFQYAIAKGLDGARREGGEVGRAAANVSKIISHGMSHYEDVE